MTKAMRFNPNEHLFHVDLEVLRMLWVFQWATPHQLARLVLGAPTRANIFDINRILRRLGDSFKIWREPKETNRTATDNREHFNARTSGGYFYGLTDAGEAYVRDVAPVYMPEVLASTCMTREFVLSMAGRHTIRHSGHYTEFCGRFVCEMRRHPLTVGIYLDTECTRLGSHLRMDGLLRHRFSIEPVERGDADAPAFPWKVPWLHGLRAPALPNLIDRTYAIEIDEGTEEISVIIGKAENYKRTFLGGMDVKGITRVPWDSIVCPAGERLPPDIRQRYFPMPVFVAPGPQRMVNIWAAWQAGWPGSGFRVTHWGLLNTAPTVVSAPYLNQDGDWVNLIGQPHTYHTRLPKAAKIPSKSTGQPA